MAKTCMMETMSFSEEKMQQLEKARRLLDILNAHIMSDEGVMKTSFRNSGVN